VCFCHSLVALSLARYIDGPWEKGAVFLEASEYLWEAAHQVGVGVFCVTMNSFSHHYLQDHENGCTDAPEMLQLHARDALNQSIYWFSNASNTCIQSDVLLLGALHLKVCVCVASLYLCCLLNVMNW
jgi:hypothetical protein